LVRKKATTAPCLPTEKLKRFGKKTKLARLNRIVVDGIVVDRFATAFRAVFYYRPLISLFPAFAVCK